MGYVPEDHRALLRKQNWDKPLQSVWDASLVLGKVMPVEETDSLSVRWQKHDNDDSDTRVLEPGKWDIGTDFPEIGLTQLAYDSTVIDGLGVMVKFDPKGLYYGDGLLDIVDGQRRVLRKWANKIERDIVKNATNNRASAKGTQFDGALTQMSGGIATGAQKHFIFSGDAGMAWNKEGDAVQQLRELATSIQNADRLAGLGGDIEFDPATSTIFIDGLAWGVLHDQLRDSGVASVSVGTSAITVPSLYGMTFAVANKAMTNTGEGLMLDLAATPLVYKQSLPPLPEYQVVGFDGTAGGEKNKVPGQMPSTSKLGLLVRDDETETGAVEVRFAHLGQALPRKVKSMAYFTAGTFYDTS